jgi:hypothetical protein
MWGVTQWAGRDCIRDDDRAWQSDLTEAKITGSTYLTLAGWRPLAVLNLVGVEAQQDRRSVSALPVTDLAAMIQREQAELIQVA